MIFSLEGCIPTPYRWMVSNPRVRDLVAAARASTPRLGPTRLVLIDGEAGAGKSSLAERLGDAFDAPVVHGDDLLEGWSGLATLSTVVAAVLGPLTVGDDSSFEAWDWHAERRGRRIDVPSSAFLVMEGVGVAQADARRWASLLVYVHAPWEERLRRGIERDADAYDDVVERWRVWDAEERTLHATDGTRDAADVVIDGTAPVLD